MAKWEDKAKQGQVEWAVIRPTVDDISTGGEKYLLQEDGSFRCEGYAPTQSSVKLKVKTDLKNITAFRLELLTDPGLPLGGPGRSLQGMGALDGIYRGGCSCRRPGEGHQVEVRESRGRFRTAGEAARAHL